MRHVYLFISAAVFALTTSTAVLTARCPYDGLMQSAPIALPVKARVGDEQSTLSPWGRQAIEIDPFGPAAQAGLRKGDIIVAQEGMSVVYASSLYADKRPGDKISVDVLREDKIVSATVILSRPGWGVIGRRLDELLIAFTFWLTSSLAVFLKPASREGRLFFLTSQVGGSALAVGSLSSFNVRWAIAVFNVLLSLLAAYSVRFHLTFPARWPLFFRRPVSRGIYVLTALLALPAVVLILQRTEIPTWYPLWRGFVRGYFALSVIASIGLLLHAYTKTRELQMRRQVRVIALGTASAFAPLVFLVVLPEAITGLSLVSYEIGFLPLVLIPVAYAIAVYKFNLLGIDRFLNRSVVHFLLCVCWVGAYLAIELILEAAPLSETPSLLLKAGSTLSLAMAFTVLRPRIQNWVDRAFYGSWYDYRSVITEVSRGLIEARDEATLVEYLVHRVKAAMDLRGVALLLPAASGTLELCACQGFDHLPEEPSLPSNCHLAQFLHREAKPVQTSQIREQLDGQSMSAAARAWLALDIVRLWVPLVFKEEIQGVLLLGEKATDEFFDDQDLRILETLGRQAALVAENVRLMTSLRRQVNELERLRSDLEVTHRRLLIGREDERKRISRELHDRLLQAYLALNMDIDGLYDLVDKPQQMAYLTAMEKKVRALAAETRRLCVELRPPSLAISGLADTIRSYTEQWAEQNEGTCVIGGFSNGALQDSSPKQTIVLDLAQDRKRLSEETAITLFRVYQEALANISKHAGAKHVWVIERLASERIQLSVRDDGCGFALPERLGDLAHREHFGLLGIQERVMAIGGKVQIVSQAGKGTEIWVSAPLNRGSDCDGE